MEYLAAVFAGMAASAGFWMIDKYLLTLSVTYQIVGSIACFLVFMVLGYWFASKVRKSEPVPVPITPPKGPQVRIGGGIDAGRDATVRVGDVDVSANADADIASDIHARRDVDASVKKVTTKP